MTANEKEQMMIDDILDFMRLAETLPAVLRTTSTPRPITSKPKALPLW